MPLSAVVDASVLVSAVLLPDSVPGLIVKLGQQGRFSQHLSPIQARASTGGPDKPGHDGLAQSSGLNPMIR
jgi:hypothetical protein